MEKSSDAQRTFRHLVVSDAVRLAPGFLAQILGGFGITLILGIYLSPEAMGLYSLFWIAQAYLATFGSGWLQNAAIRYLPENVNRTGFFLKTSLLLTLLLALLSLLLAPLLVWLFSPVLSGENVLWTVVIFLGAALFSLFQGILRGAFQQHHFSISALLLALSKIGLLLWLLPAPAGESH